MKGTQINSELAQTKEMMDLLFACVKDKSLSISERNKYYSEYLQTSTYYLKLQQVKPQHTFTIA